MRSRQDPQQPDKDVGERELLRQIAAGDRDALAALYRLYHPRLFKFVFRLTRSYGASDELVNDIMLVVWNKAGSFRGDSRLSTWLFGIAYRQALRKLSRKTLSIARDVEPDSLSDTRSSVVEQQDWIRQGIERLPPAQQLAVILVFYVGLSYDEVAQVTEVPVNTVKTRMFHARRKLKAALQRIEQPSTASVAGESTGNRNDE